MTDDKLREACERVAKAWLPGKLEVDSRETDEDKESLVGMLASPWGMDLLLDAAEKRRVTVKYENLIAADNKGIIHEWYIFAPPSSYDDGERQIGFGEDTNRYAALILALDKATEAPNENS